MMVMPMDPTPNAPSSLPPHRVTRSLQWERRLYGGLIAAAAAVVLGIAAWLTPAADGHGTHEQMGLQPCGWMTVADMPCPTCGMTTSFAHAAEGHLLTAFHVQPFGAILALATTCAMLIAAYVALTGSRLGQAFGGLWRRSVIIVVVAGFLLAWGYKIVDHRRNDDQTVRASAQVSGGAPDAPPGAVWRRWFLGDSGDPHDSKHE